MKPPEFTTHTTYEPTCPCVRCANELTAWLIRQHKITQSEAFFRNQRMFVCGTCGNKRCPRSDDHRNDCTGSNETGQPGSRYRFVAPAVLDPAEMGPDYEANEGRAIRDCTCGHAWPLHDCWPTHIAGGECFRCDCVDFTERGQS